MKFINEELYKNNIGIYGIKNLINKKVYVGQTGERFLRRYWHHQWKLRNNSHDNAHLQRAWNKYGENNFEYIVLEIVDDVDLLDKLEIKHINHYKQNNKSYNMLLGGGGRRGLPLSEQAKKIIGEKNRQHMLGYKHSEETKRKMSKIRTGRRVDKSTDILNPNLVKQIKLLLINGKTAKEVSDELSVEYRLINNLISNNTWKTVFVDGWDEFRKNRPTYNRLTKYDHYKIYKLHIEENLNKHELADMYSKTVKMIEKIFREQRKLYDNPVPSLE